MANNKNQHQSWLTKQRSQLGDDWLNTISQDVIEKNKFTLIQDIAYSNLDLTNPLEVKDFSNPKIFNILYQYTKNRMFKLQEVYNSLLSTMTYNSEIITNSQYMNETFDNIKKCFDVYKFICDSLDVFSYTGNIYIITSLCNNLVKHRQYININNIL